METGVIFKTTKRQRISVIDGSLLRRGFNNVFYALVLRRGRVHIKNVKASAEERGLMVHMKNVTVKMKRQ